MLSSINVECRSIAPASSQLHQSTAYDWPVLIGNAWRKRSQELDTRHTDSWRVFHGYDEGAPGIVIEKFSGLAVVEFKHDIREELDSIRSALLSCFDFKVIVAKGSQQLGLRLKNRLFCIHGRFDDASTHASEFGVRYALEPDAVHNCGLYLDARPVRQWLLNTVNTNERILNLFAFTGSLGLAAKVAGAWDVIHLDKSRELLPRIEASYQANGLKLDSRDFIQGDIYKHLPRAIKRGQRFNGIILDPPPKVYQSRHANHAIRGQDFSGLVALCTKLLEDQAWLICMYHRFDASWEESDAEVIAASGGKLAVSERFTSDEDFCESDPEKKLRVSVFRKT